MTLRAGAGGRIGSSYVTDGNTVEFSLLGKVWNEFEGKNTVTVSDGVTTESYTDDTSGIFGEVSGTIAFSNADRMFSGFLSGGGEFGANFTSYTGTFGLRKDF